MKIMVYFIIVVTSLIWVPLFIIIFCYSGPARRVGCSAMHRIVLLLAVFWAIAPQSNFTSKYHQDLGIFRFLSTFGLISVA